MPATPASAPYAVSGPDFVIGRRFVIRRIGTKDVAWGGHADGREDQVIRGLQRDRDSRATSS
jgi:hypothetical protein